MLVPCAKKMNFYLISTLLLAANTLVAGSCCSNTSSCNTTCCNTPCSGTACAVLPFVPVRSQGTNSARDYAGVIQLYRDVAQTGYHGILSIAAEYTNSFRPSAVSSALFGCDLVESRNVLQGGLSLNITGSSIEDLDLDSSTWSRNNTKDWLADYFLLPIDFAAQVHFVPRIQNVIADISLCAMGEGKLEGFYSTIKLPFAWTKYDLSAYETIEQHGSKNGYDIAITNSMTLNSFFDLSCNRQGLSFSQDGSPITNIPLNCSRICPCPQGKAGLADLPLTLGYNYLQPHYHVGAYGRVVAPTGNAPKGSFLFEPIIGNGHHWELGGGATAYATLWHPQEDDKELAFVFDCCLTHLFAAQQVRVFDLKNKPWSRYILAKQFDDTGTPTGIRGQVANLTSCPIKVSYAVQTDLVAFLSYRSESFIYDFGYNLWARSCEKLCRTSCATSADCCGSCSFTKENWGLGVTTPDQTESASTIHESIAMLGVPADSSPVYITNDDIAYDSTQTKSLTHKLFMHLGYEWLEHKHPPFIGFGGEIELGSINTCNMRSVCATGCNSGCSCCRAFAISQWGVWLKGGVAF